jgi:hypothetical protein
MFDTQDVSEVRHSRLQVIDCCYNDIIIFYLSLVMKVSIEPGMLRIRH